MKLVCSRTSYDCGLTAVSSSEPDVDVFVAAVAAAAEDIGAGFALVFYSQSLMSAADLAQTMSQQLPKLHYAACSTAGEITPAGLQDGQVVAILFAAPAFCAVSALVRDVSTTGIDAVSGAVESLKRALAETSDVPQGNVFALCLIDGCPTPKKL